MRDRLTAVGELQKQYPAYFGNLSQEQILNGNVTGAVKELTNALIAKAKASAYSSKIADLAVEEFKLREKESKLLDEIKKQQNEVDLKEKLVIEYLKNNKNIVLKLLTSKAVICYIK